MAGVVRVAGGPRPPRVVRVPGQHYELPSAHSPRSPWRGGGGEARAGVGARVRP